eukprot:SAG31_NODE_13066_length_895_cov_1.095477_1_plen_201_part_10
MPPPFRRSAVVVAIALALAAFLHSLARKTWWWTKRLEDPPSTADPANFAKYGRRMEQQMRLELTPLKMSCLKKKAREAGVNDETLDAADDSEDPKEHVVSILLDMHRRSSSADAETPVGADRLEALRAELSGLKPSQLKKRAVAEGITAEQMDEADDSDDPREAVLALILAAAAAAHGPAGDGATTGARATMVKELRTELA